MSLAPLNPSHYAMRGTRRSSATQAHAAHMNGAPVAGIDVTQTLVAADPNTAITLENLIPRVYGCELRRGFSKWATGLGGEVRSLMPYNSSTGVKLFAASSNGSIYDVTELSQTPPTPIYTHPVGDVTGEWYSVNYVNDAGSFLLSVSAGEGYHVYDGTTWVEIEQGTNPGQINGIDPKLLAFIFVWKGFVWFLRKDSALAYVLPYGQITGTVEEINFGPYLSHGGPLEIGHNWTVDAGDGMDDKLVLFGREGDVLLYGGSDPFDANKFAKQGSYYIGHLPSGRRCVSRYSTDLAILSEKGLCFLSELLRGQGFFMNAAIAQRVNSSLAQEVAAKMTQPYWEVAFLAHEQLIIINTPTSTAIDKQWAYEVNTKSFCTLTGMPMLSVTSFDRRTFFGDTEGNVWFGFDGSSDGAVYGTRGKDLEGTVVSAFLPFGEPYRLKRFMMVRPAFLAPVAPAVKVGMNADWSFSAPKGSPQFAPPLGSSLWDSGIWDQTVWNGSEQSYGVWVGVEGMGYYGALSMKVRGEPGTTFVSWQLLEIPGGVL